MANNAPPVVPSLQDGDKADWMGRKYTFKNPPGGWILECDHKWGHPFQVIDPSLPERPVVEIQYTCMECMETCYKPVQEAGKPE